MKTVKLWGLFLVIGLLSWSPAALWAQTTPGSAERAKGEKAFAEKDYAQAMIWCRKAADQGDSAAQVEVGFLYEKGLGVTPDYKKAMKWFKKSAALNNGGAEFDLGDMYDNGLGVSKDLKQAVFWYKKSAARGNKKAQERVDTIQFLLNSDNWKGALAK
jgi:TPR repeat protein